MGSVFIGEKCVLAAVLVLAAAGAGAQNMVTVDADGTARIQGGVISLSAISS